MRAHVQPPIENKTRAGQPLAPEAFLNRGMAFQVGPRAL
jgi:hypothetical protein